MKAVPGRKTDVKDSEWLADLLRHGLLKASFIPPQPMRELRELTRYRQRLVHERTQAVNRLQKVLESANITVGTLATDLLGVSGRAMLDALIADEQTPTEMANLARGRMRSRIPALRQALEGRVTSNDPPPVFVAADVGPHRFSRPGNQPGAGAAGAAAGSLRRSDGPAADHSWH
jgi:transposase